MNDLPHDINAQIATLERICARERIHERIYELGLAFDSGPSRDLLMNLFCDDAVFKIDIYGEIHGLNNIVETVCSNSRIGFSWTMHYFIPGAFNVSIDEKVARGKFKLWEMARSASGKCYWIGGHYDAVLRLMDGGDWRFHELELFADIISEYPIGWSNKPLRLEDA